MPHYYRTRRLIGISVLLLADVFTYAHASPLFDFPANRQAQPPLPHEKPRGGMLPKLVLGLEQLSDEYQEYLLKKQQAQQQGKSIQAFMSKRTLSHLINENVVIDAVALNNAGVLVQALQTLNASNIVQFGRTVSAIVPLNELPQLAQLPSLSTAQPALSMTQTGTVTSQGDMAMQSNVVRSNYNVDGSGVTVGVLSDSYNCTGGAAAGVSSGDLPSGVNVVLDDNSTGCTGNDEGRAMLEIVHDVAPGAGLAFNTANLGEASFAQGILNLANTANADVIVDDVIYLTEPMFQDGNIAQAVDTVGNQGIAYFSAAGNQSSASYETGYTAGATFAKNAFNRGTAFAPLFQGGVAHDFSGSGDYFQQISLQPGASMTLVLEWQNAFPSLGGNSPVADDFDIYLLDTSNLVIAGSAVDQSVGADPVEIFSINYSGTTATTANVMILRHSGSGSVRLKYVMYKSGISIDEYNTASGTIYGHANAAHARAIGAAYYNNTPAFGVAPPLLEGFSSRGGTPIFYDVIGNPLPVAVDRHKPEIVAPDGGNTTFFYPGSDRDGDGYPNFSGTSAAAPHAGGVAALLKSAQVSASPTQIFEALQDSAIDMKTPGYDVDSGFGLIQADSAINYLLSQVDNALLGFSSSVDGTPLVSGGTFSSTEYASRGVTIEDNDSTPAEIAINSIAVQTAGIKGNFIQVNGSTPQITLTFSPTINNVQFDFVSSDGNVNATAYDAGNIAILTTSFSGIQSFTTTGLSGLAGHAQITTTSPMTKLVIDASAIDNLQFSNVTVTPVAVPALSSVAKWLLFLVLLAVGVRMMQVESRVRRTSY